MKPIKILKRFLRSTGDSLSRKGKQAKEWNALQRARLNFMAKLHDRKGRVAIVGCGVMGRHIAQSTRLLPNWSVSAICDRQADSLTRVKAISGGDVFATTELGDLLKNREKFDVLAIATTAPSHVPIAIQAIEAGVLAILLEKPVSNCLASVDQLVKAANWSGCRIAVDHTRRWIAGGDGIKRLLESGVIGKLIAIHAVPGRGGMAMIGTHFFDFSRWIVGADFQCVRAELDDVVRVSHRGAEFLDRSGRCEAKFTNGVRLTVDLSDAIAMAHGYILLVGDSGRIEIDERFGRVRLLGAGKRVWEKKYAWPGLAGHGVAAALCELLGSEPIQCSIEDGVAALSVAIACNVSSRENGRWVELPLADEYKQEVFPFA